LGAVVGAPVDVVCSDRAVRVHVEPDGHVRESALALPADALERLGLSSPAATRLRFRVKKEGHRLELGPVIGILAHVNAHEKPRPQDPGYKFIHAAWNIENLGGLIYFFSPDGIDWDARMVRGFVHIPGRVEWEAGRFPFPQAVYRRIPVAGAL